MKALSRCCKQLITRRWGDIRRIFVWIWPRGGGRYRLPVFVLRSWRYPAGHGSTDFSCVGKSYFSFI